MIPIIPPNVGPKVTEEAQSFGDLFRVQDVSSTAIGWVISLGKELRENGVDSVQTKMLPLILEKMVDADSRAVNGYALLLYFVEKVRQLTFKHACM